MQDAARRPYTNVLGFVTSQPWLITPEGFDLMSQVVSARLDGVRLTEQEAAEVEKLAAARPTQNTVGGIMVIPLQGMLVPRASLFTAMSGGTSMQAFGRAVADAANDPKISQIVLDVDSPGGAAELIPETAAIVRAAAAKKPITAVVNTMCGSGALWLASQCSSVSITPSGEIGSLGVFAAHVDRSQQREMAGIRTTLIRSAVSPYKTELREPLTPEATAYVQAEVDRLGEMFVDEVALGRGADPAQVATDYGQGRMLSAEAALAAGMVDRVETLDETIARLQSQAPAPARGYGVEHLAVGDWPDKNAEAKASDPEETPKASSKLVPGSEALLAHEGFREAFRPGSSPKGEA